MNSFKLIVLSVLSATNIRFINAQDNLVIPGASYAVFDGANSTLPNQRDPGYEDIRFYRFDGTLLKVVEDYYGALLLLPSQRCRHSATFVAERLDKNAPKPQPVSYKIEFRKPVSIYMQSDYYTYKYPAGCWMLFYDKNGNIIGEHCCIDENSDPTCFEHDFDLSIIKKIN